MANPRSAPLARGARAISFVVVTTLLVLLFVLPATTVAVSPTPSISIDPASGSGVAANVTWNGANILNFPSATSAARIGFNGVVDVHYVWSSTGGVLAPFTINDARLQIFYFGFALATRDIVNSAAAPATSGTFDMNWTTGALQYVLEGSYKLVASLLAPNGTTMWSQAFWVFVAAPYDVAALLPIVLILLIVWEVYNLATVGRQAGLGKQPPSAPPATSSPDSPPQTSGAADAAAPPSTEPTTPPPEGGSS
jgi:hypothetical protein